MGFDFLPVIRTEKKNKKKNRATINKEPLLFSLGMVME